MPDSGKQDGLVVAPTIVSELGRGASATVYLVEDPVVRGRQLAMKRFAPDVSFLTERQLASEANVLRSLNHEFIAMLVGEGADENGQYLLVEYVDGVALDEFCDANRLPLRERLLLLRNILRAVEHAHSRFIVHADLKPANVLVTPAGEPKLVDFGVAQWLSKRAGSHIDTGRGFTSHFAAPEQRSGGEITVRTDLYSLGVLAHLLLTEELPQTAGDLRTITMSAVMKNMETARQQAVVGQRSTSAAALIAELRGDLDLWVLRATEHDPQQRYASAAEMAADLDAYLSGSELKVNPASAIRRAMIWGRRHPALAATGAAVALVLAVTCSVVAVQHARFVRQQRLTEERLLEDLKLTDAYRGELRLSVASLPQSDAARNALADGASNALLQLAADGPYSERVDEELARESAETACAAQREPGTSRERVQQIAASAGKILTNVPQPGREQIAHEIDVCVAQSVTAAQPHRSLLLPHSP